MVTAEDFRKLERLEMVSLKGKFSPDTTIVLVFSMSTIFLSFHVFLVVDQETNFFL